MKYLHLLFNISLILFILSIILFCVLIKSAYDIHYQVEVFLIGNDINISTDINTTLKNLLTQNKLISAKDFFGAFIGVYNNIFIVLVCIIGLSGIFGFVYIKNRTEEQMEASIKKYMDNEAKIKEIASNTLKSYFENMLDEQDKEYISLKEKIEELESRIYELEDEKNTKNTKFELEVKDSENKTNSVQ